ncbi:hypothetical protein L596_013293 [Steinernema carpocapsae]|uniref:Uncharacterized protein n=1 Tax=Steinernema carpocapsae TaxID=34508 RepID=A0A4U5NZQ3_STECR|nr:hypothetical protein L596_013293 [Steinernema carpocapsae]
MVRADVNRITMAFQIAPKVFTQHGNLLPEIANMTNREGKKAQSGKFSVRVESALMQKKKFMRLSCSFSVCIKRFS